LRKVVDFVVVLLKVPQEVFSTHAVSTRFVMLLVLLRSCWSCGGLRPDVAYWLIAGTLSGVGHRLTCGCCICFMLSTCNSGGVGILALYVLLFRLPGLRRYVCRDYQDLAVWDLKHFSRVDWGDGRTSNLKREAIWRRLMVDLPAMSCEQRSTKLLEHMAPRAVCLEFSWMGQGSSR
jgi:hypothetical protein